MNSERPYIILKAALSLNGYLDAGTGERTILSDEPDLQSVDVLRATCDAILIGGGTARYDNPSLLIKSDSNIKERIKKNTSPHPKRIILWGSTPLVSYLNLKIFQPSDAETVIFLHHSLKDEAASMLPSCIKSKFFVSEILSPDEIIREISQEDVKKLLIEGGAKLSQDFMETRTYDELRLTYSPVIIPREHAVTFNFPVDFLLTTHRSEISQSGNMTLIKLFNS